MDKVNDKIVLITGASSGIGKQTVFDFAKHKPKTIVLVARSISKLKEIESIIKKRSDIEICPFQCDVSKKTEVIRMSEQVIGRYGYIDILVNNAGFGIYGKVMDQTIEELESITFTNYLGSIYCTKVFLEPMIARQTGKIINVASLAGSFGIPGLAAYCGSKFAMLGFFEALSHELKGTGVSVTTVSPIGVKTNFFNNESFKRNTPNYTGFMLDPKSVSRAILDAVDSRRLEITVPFFMRAGVWLKHTFPYLVNPLVGAQFRKELDKSKDPS